MILLSGFIFFFCTSRSFDSFIKKEVLHKNVKEYHKTMADLKESEIVNLMDEVLEEKQDGINLYKKLGTVEMLEQALFKDHHRALLPLVLIL